MSKSTSNFSTAPTVISLFSGAGGLDLAVETLGLNGHAVGRKFTLPKVVVATDYDESAGRSYSKNFPSVPYLCTDIRELSATEILHRANLSRAESTLVVGGPPCTPFSKSGFWLEEKRTSSDPDASLLDEYVRIVEETRPEAVVLENVQGLTYKVHRAQFQRLMTGLTRLGYNPNWKVLIAADYGVPQLRRRVFVVGRRDGERFDFPAPTHSGWSERDHEFDPGLIPYVTAGDALCNLADVAPENGELVEGQYAELACEVPPGQNYLWHTDRYDGQNVFKWRSRYWTFLLRLTPDRPATTIQAQPGPYVGPFHWENIKNVNGAPRARRLRIPELKQLMTFPRGYAFLGSRQQVQRQIGNAVPPLLGAVVIKALLEQLGRIPSRTKVDPQSRLF